MRRARRGDFLPLCRRHLRVEPGADTADERSYRLDVEGLPAAVTHTDLSLEIEVPSAWCRYPRVWVDGAVRPEKLVRPRTLRVHVEVDGVELAFSRAD